MQATVLVADDSSTIRKIVELTFQDTAIRVESVGGGLEALERLQTAQPDLLLADVVMPEPSGYDLCQRIKQSARPIPVVLLTGAFEDFDADRAHRAGADDRLVKPFESQMLRDTVERLLRESTVPAGSPLAPEDADELDALSAELDESRPGQGPDGRDAAPDDREDAYDEDDDDPLEELSVQVGPPTAATARLAPEDIEAVADAVVRRLSGDVVRELAREMLPEIATTLVRERIRELEDEERG